MYLVHAHIVELYMTRLSFSVDVDHEKLSLVDVDGRPDWAFLLVDGRRQVHGFITPWLLALFQLPLKIDPEGIFTIIIRDRLNKKLSQNCFISFLESIQEKQIFLKAKKFYYKNYSNFFGSKLNIVNIFGQKCHNSNFVFRK